MVAIQQTPGFRLVQRPLHRIQGHAGAFGKHIHLYPVDQAHRIEHEFKAELAARDFLFFLHRIAETHLLHIALRLLVTCLPDDAMRE
ncbi:hypothetical protein D3C81_2000530 [compost metagenome]